MFGTMSTAVSGARNMLVGIVLAASLVSGDTVVNLLLGDSSIGESNFVVVEGQGAVLEASVIGVDSTATTFDVACTTTSSIPFPFTTFNCVGGDHVTITQGASTMSLSQVFTTSDTTQSVREDCTFSNTETVTCSFLNSGGDATSSEVFASPTNAPLLFPVTITAGQDKLGSQATATTTTPGITEAPSSTIPSSSGTVLTTRSGAERNTVRVKWTLLSTLLMIACLVFYKM